MVVIKNLFFSQETFANLIRFNHLQKSLIEQLEEKMHKH
jgi:hypothetical protein